VMASDRFGHRAAAGVAETDEEDAQLGRRRHGGSLARRFQSSLICIQSQHFVDRAFCRIAEPK
jgi:hypothetical protein